MAHMSRLLWWKHLRAEPSEYIILFRRGVAKRQGRGLSAWFYPLSTAIAMLPVEDCQTTFVLTDRTADLQPVAVQCTVTYRFVDMERASSRSNFSISLDTGRWIENPLERLASFWSQRVRDPARAHLIRLPLGEAVKAGAQTIRAAVVAALAADQELGMMGLGLVDFQVEQISPPPDLAKALETPTREAVQQKADEAVFQRRALAVEKERAIKEAELATKVEMAKRQDELIKLENTNRSREIEGKASGERLRVTSEVELATLAAEGHARDVKTRAGGDAEARRLLGDAEAHAQAARAAAWRDVPGEVLAGLAAQELASKIQTIESVTVTPDQIGQALTKLLGKKGG